MVTSSPHDPNCLGTPFIFNGVLVSDGASMNEDRHHNQGICSLGAGNPLGTKEPAITPSIDDVFDLLANEDRRETCLFLMSIPEPVITVENILDALCEGEPDRDREQLAIDLHHRHLPKLEAAGIIDYDPRSNTARYWGQPTVEKWAEHVRAVDQRPEQTEA